jgi:hypothetical protein
MNMNLPISRMDARFPIPDGNGNPDQFVSMEWNRDTLVLRFIPEEIAGEKITVARWLENASDEGKRFYETIALRRARAEAATT